MHLNLPHYYPVRFFFILLCSNKISHFILLTAADCLQDPKPQKMLLSGYGVELAIKSTEYKAVDDTKVKGQFVTLQFLLLFLRLPNSIRL